jgi:hypothetical protein
MTTPDPGALRTTLSLLAAAAVMSSSCQMGPGNSLAVHSALPALLVRAHADEPVPAAATDATIDSAAALAAARWHLWRAAFASPAGPVLAEAASAADPARGAKP